MQDSVPSFERNQLTVSGRPLQVTRMGETLRFEARLKASFVCTSDRNQYGDAESMLFTFSDRGPHADLVAALRKIDTAVDSYSQLQGASEYVPLVRPYKPGLVSLKIRVDKSMEILGPGATEQDPHHVPLSYVKKGDVLDVAFRVRSIYNWSGTWGLMAHADIVSYPAKAT